MAEHLPAPGAVSERFYVVAPEHTAAHLGSGGVPVYATPMMVLHMEETALAAVDPHLGHGRATVGASISVRHLAPTPVGMTVRVRAELVETDGRKFSFRIEAWDDIEKIGEAEHLRVAVDLAKLSAKIGAKIEAKGTKRA